MLKKLITYLKGLFSFHEPITGADYNQLDDYGKAFRKMPKRVLDKKHHEHLEFMNKYMTPIRQKMHMLRTSQRTIMKPGRIGEPKQMVIKWSPESKQRMKQLEKEEEKIYRIAENKFWKGYEHLKPVNDE